MDNYVFQRYLFAADWHIGKRFRAYGEFQSGLINGKLASPRPSDENVADIHQAFVEIRSPKERPRQASLRLGRQEMTIGSSRLISAAQGLNVKRSFDGVVTAFRTGGWSVEGGVARLVGVGQGAFDDVAAADQHFWGASVARRNFLFKGGTGGAYYLGIDRKQSTYAQGIGSELRHTVGVKFTGAWKAFDFNYDLVGQWGTFASADVRRLGDRHRELRARREVAVASPLHAADELRLGRPQPVRSAAAVVQPAVSGQCLLRRGRPARPDQSHGRDARGAIGGAAQGGHHF